MKRTIIYFWKNNPSFGIRWDTKIVLIGLNHWGHSKGDSRVRTMQNLLTNTTKTWRNVMLLFIKLKKLFKSASFRISPRSFEQHKLHVLILHCYFTQTISFKSFTANTIQTKGQRTSNIKRTANIEHEKSLLKNIRSWAVEPNDKIEWLIVMFHRILAISLFLFGQIVKSSTTNTFWCSKLNMTFGMHFRFFCLCMHFRSNLYNTKRDRFDIKMKKQECWKFNQISL